VIRRRYYAVTEPDDAGGFWISFPDRPGITSAAKNAAAIVAQAHDALASVLMYPPAELPRPIEDGATPPADLSGYDAPLVAVVPFEAAA
jgi:predicted RNase H-like HicB family nuclease